MSLNSNEKKENIIIRLINYIYNILPFKRYKSIIKNKIEENIETIKKIITISAYTYPLYLSGLVIFNLYFFYGNQVPDIEDLHTENDYKLAMKAYSDEIFMLHDDSLKSKYKKLAYKEVDLIHRQDPDGEAKLISYGRTNIGNFKNLATNTFYHSGKEYRQIMYIPDYLFIDCYEGFINSKKPYENIYKCVRTVSFRLNQVREGLKAKGDKLKLTDMVLIFEDTIEIFREDEIIKLKKGIDYEIKK